MPAKRYKLYATENGWDTKHAALMAHFNMPNEVAQSYARKETVMNESSDDHGKFIMPVIQEGPFDARDQFSSGVVDWVDEWSNLPGS